MGATIFRGWIELRSGSGAGRRRACGDVATLPAEGKRRCLTTRSCGSARRRPSASSLSDDRPPRQLRAEVAYEAGDLLGILNPEQPEARRCHKRKVPPSSTLSLSSSVQSSGTVTSRIGVELAPRGRRANWAPRAVLPGFGARGVL